MLFPALKAGFLKRAVVGPPPTPSVWIETNRNALFDFSDSNKRTLSSSAFFRVEDAGGNNYHLESDSGDTAHASWPSLATFGARQAGSFDGTDGMWGVDETSTPRNFTVLMSGSKRAPRTLYFLLRNAGTNPTERKVLMAYYSWSNLNGLLQFGISTNGRPYIVSRSLGGAEVFLEAQNGTFTKNGDNLFGYTIKADGTVSFSLNGTMLTVPTGTVHNENLPSGGDWNVSFGHQPWAGGIGGGSFVGSMYIAALYGAAHASAEHTQTWNAAQTYLGTSPGPGLPTETITLNPTNPGTYTVETAGTTVQWTTNVVTSGLSQFQYAVFTASNVARGGWVTQNIAAGATTTGITVTFSATGDYVIVRKVNDDTLRALSSGVTINVQTTGSGVSPIPSGWVIDVTDHFDGTSLDSSKWKHAGFGGPAHRDGNGNPAAEWDNGAGISVHDSVAELQVYRGGPYGWMVTGWLQGITTDPSASYGYHPGYGEFHIRIRARWSHAFAPGIGAYMLMWPANQSIVPHSEFDIMEMPSGDTGGMKTRHATAIHWLWESAQHDSSSVDKYNIDLTQYHVWDFRRTFSTVNGQQVATFNVWIDGVELSDNGNRPWRWDNNPDTLDRVVFGPATFVGSESGWYGFPNSNSPSPASLYIDYVTIWVPGSGTPPPPQRSMSFSPSSPGTIQEQVAGAGVQWTTTITSTGLTSVSWVVVENGTWAWRGSPTAVATNGSVQITATLLKSGDFIKVMDTSDFNFQVDSGQVTILPAAGGGGGGTPGANPAPAVHVVGRGQSNMLIMGESGWVDGAWWMVSDLVRVLTGIPEVISHLDRWEDDGSYTVASGTDLYTFRSPVDYSPWFEARGFNQSDPSSWPLVAHGLGFRQYVLNNIASDGRANTPVLLVDGHTEYPQQKPANELPVWHAAHTNFLDRYRSWTGRSVAQSPIFLAYIPYRWTQGDAIDTIRASHFDQIANASRNTHRAEGGCSDTTGDGSHWDGPGNAVAARRMGFALSRWLHDNGYAHNDLSWLPKTGPRINTVNRTSNGNRLRVNVTHDKGSSLVMPGAFSAGNNFSVWDTTGFTAATGASIVDNNNIDITFIRNITGTNSEVWFSYGMTTDHRGLDSMITDNWHTGSVSKPAGAWSSNAQFNAAKFPLNTTLRYMNLVG
jgi:hypothetical protein